MNVLGFRPFNEEELLAFGKWLLASGKSQELNANRPIAFPPPAGICFLPPSIVDSLVPSSRSLRRETSLVSIEDIICMTSQLKQGLLPTLAQTKKRKEG
jgi:hypothetical protein